MAAVAIAGVVYARLLRDRPFASDDFEWVYARIPGYLHAFAEGQIPPRVFPEAFGGAGFAFPHFYPPLSQWAAAAFAALTGSPVVGAHLSFYLAALVSGLGMFLFLHAATGSRQAGLVGSVIYTTLPYHLADTFLRGALAESWAFAWMPLAGLGALHVVRKHGNHGWLFPVALSGLVLSHRVMALYFATGCVLVGPWIWRRVGGAATARLTLGAVVGVALSLWYLLPSQIALGRVVAGVPELMQATEPAVRQSAPRPGNPFFSIDLAPWVLLFIAWRMVKKSGGCSGLVRLPEWGYASLVVAVLYTAYAYLPGSMQWAMPAQYAYIQFPFRVFAITGGLVAAVIAALVACGGGRRMTAFLAIAGVAVGSPWAILPGGDAPPARLPDYPYTGLNDYVPVALARKGVFTALDRTAAGVRDRGARWTREDGLIDVDLSGYTGSEITLPIIYYDFYSAETLTGERVRTRDDEGQLRLEGISGVAAVRISVRNPATFWVGVITGALALLIWQCALTGTGRPSADKSSADSQVRRPP